MLSAIIVAGGSGQRMGFDKILAPLGDRPVVAHSLAAFEEAESVDHIVLVGRAERLSEFNEIVRAAGFKKISAVVAGGPRRQDSVRQGLEQIDSATTFVAVHDAARPLVRANLVERIYQAVGAHGGAASAAPVVDTVKRTNAARVVVGGVDRENLFAVETPQIFRRALLAEAYAAVFADGIEVSDEISAVERMGGQVVLVSNEEPNFKLTYPADFALAELVVRQRMGPTPRSVGP